MRTKTILLIAMPNSVHTARWVSQVIDQGWNVYIFSSTGIEKIHPDLHGVTLVKSPLGRLETLLEGFGLWLISELLRLSKPYLAKKFPGYPVTRLRNTIKRLHPDLIHAMEMQAAGYLTLQVQKSYPGTFPPWLMTIWGSDISLFSRLQEHRETIRSVLSQCDYFSCECARDLALATQLGFSGHMFPELPVSGGFDLTALTPVRSKDTSSRRVIMLKGYQGWAGRALCGLRALERCVDLLTDYTLVVFSAAPEVVIATELFTEKTGVQTKILPHSTSHQEILAMHGQARISIGLGISDGISVSLQEAMVMGSFPIQSCTACADEWITHGVSGLIVPPEDPELIETAIRTALSDDHLVDEAARINWQVAQARLDSSRLQQMAIDMYRTILQ